MSFLFIIFLFLSFGVFTTHGLFTLGKLTRTIYEHPLVVSNAALNAALNITKMHRNMKDVVLSSSYNEREIALKAVDNNEQIVHQQLDIIKKDILGDKGIALQKQTRQLFIKWRPIREEVVLLLQTGKKQEAVYITKNKGAHHVAKLEEKMLDLTLYAREKATGFMGFAETSQSNFEVITIVLTLVGVFLSVTIAVVTSFFVLKSKKVLLDERDKLKKALDEINALRGIIPICSYCKQIRNDEGIWNKIEQYIHEHSEARFSHSICPECMKTHFPEEYASIHPDEKQDK